MSDRITPERARHLLTDPWFMSGDDFAQVMPAVRMIARAHYEYAIARRTDAGVEYETQFFEWSADPDFAGWTFDRVALENSAEDGEFIARRLIIDLPEEDV